MMKKFFVVGSVVAVDLVVVVGCYSGSVSCVSCT